MGKRVSARGRSTRHFAAAPASAVARGPSPGELAAGAFGAMRDVASEEAEMARVESLVDAVKISTSAESRRDALLALARAMAADARARRASRTRTARAACS